MSLFTNIPLQRKLTLITLLTAGVVMLLACVALFIFQSVNFRKTYIRDMETLANMFSDNCTAAVTFKDATSGEEILAALRAKPGILGAEIRLLDGTTLARYGQDEAGLQLKMGGLGNADEHQFIMDFFVLNKSINLDRKQIGTLRLWSDYRSDYRALLQLYSGILLAVLGVSLGLSYMLSSRLQRVISSPILKLAETARIVAENNDYSVRAQQLGRDEVGLLTEAFNRMLARVEAQNGELRLSKQQFESLVNSIDGIVWEWNPHDSKFTFISRQSERILGHAPQEWLGNPKFWDALVHPDDLVRAAAVRREATAHSQPYSSEYRMVASGGRTVWIRESGMVLVEQGQLLSVRGIFQDITEHKNAAAALDRLNQQLVDSSREAGMAEVATGILHNVGNVLNSVGVSTALVGQQLRRSEIPNLRRATGLLRDKNGSLADYLMTDPKGRLLPQYLVLAVDQLANEQAQMIAEIDSVAEHITHIKQIVAMQQSYAKVSGAFENLSPAKLAEDALQMNAASFEHNHIQVVREIARDAPPVCVDRHKVLQILINLLHNAKHALLARDAHDKKLVMRVEVAEPDRVKIIVRDNGIGIAPDHLVKIFNHGFTTKKDGHGFGLHTSANAAKEMGGSLTAQSEGVGLGASFILELPIADQPRPGSTPQRRL